MIILRQKDFARLLKRNPQFEKKVKRTAEEKMQMKLNKLVGTARAPKVKSADQMEFLDKWDQPFTEAFPHMSAKDKSLTKHWETLKENSRRDNFAPFLEKHKKYQDKSGKRLPNRGRTVKDIQRARHGMNDITSGAEGVGNNTDLVLARRDLNRGWPNNTEEATREFWEKNKKKYYSKKRGIWLAY